jgi:hypothetical protein
MALKWRPTVELLLEWSERLEKVATEMRAAAAKQREGL